MSHMSKRKTEPEDFDIAEPRADAMSQSLRAFGYDLATAVADLVDNSISASAKHVSLEFFWDGEASWFSISDDGHGMSEDELVNAMRPSSQSPLTPRDSKDLGRFGLGLKTASFSQCRTLTVASRVRRGGVAIRRWDLDYLASCGEWRLLRTGSAVCQEQVERLKAVPSGTLVLWEDLDRVAAHTDVGNAAHHELFLARVDGVKQHLSMVFHRFLDGPRAVKIEVNGTPVRPWDPFLVRSDATQLLAEEAVSLFGSRLKVKPYVLPHRSKVDLDTYRAAAGPNGWNAQQGFYVYRNRRLLVAGDWLGLGFAKEEHYNLARIMLDIPNSTDAEWQIDVKKSRAYPPAAVRGDLKRLAEVTRRRAREVYRHRGARLHRGPVDLVFLWEKRVRHGRISYRISREHPLVKDVISNAGGLRRRAKALLNLIEETVPVPTITIDNSETPTDLARPFERSPSALQTVLRETYEALRRSGLTQADARLRIIALEPFNEYPELVAALDDGQGEG